MTLNINTKNLIYNHSKQNVNVYSQKNNSDIFFQSQNKDVFENSKKDNKCNIKKWNLAILTTATLLGCDLLFNHGKVIKSVWSKIVSNKSALNSESENIGKIREHFSQIFNKNVPQDEAQILFQKYKNIFKMDTTSHESTMKYISTLYSQVMKDFGFNTEKLYFMLCKKDTPLYASMSASNDYLQIYCLDKHGKILADFSKEHYFESLCHELTHARQHNIAYATDKEAYIDALIHRFKQTNHWQDVLANYNNDEKLASDYIKSIYTANLEKGLCSDMKPITSDNPDYNKGLQYIDGTRNYKQYSESATLNEYRSQLIEKEAYHVSDIARELHSYLSK